MEEKTKGGSVEIASEEMGCHVIAYGSLGSILRINVWQPEEYTGEVWPSRVGLMAFTVIPLGVIPEVRPFALFILNQPGSHGYALGNSDIPEPDAVDGLVSVNLGTMKYFDLLNFRRNFK